ncbi:histidinol-phosphate transaminase [Noviherbaspirillum autotrophicum]|uniref:Histidinol-phosphate aminotransferase n=1 Tax=Noviherbaspirillum autotrophicum TaxID=709839 RepID=A0A0C1XZX0_9BURK|nr:histidinol-phosphate transaminase [Noviherbaspirillum autotrophicum]KIF80343.1 histidinol-phosphate aminotransferase [Noviherbaspirillum autotrophicum]
MPLIENIIRPDVRALSAYHVPDSAGFVKLDAMENPYTLPEPLRAELGRRLADVAMNRYPVPSYAALKTKICDKLGVPAGFDVVLGNGSDELISIISIACAKPGAKVLAPMPGFVMYAMSARFAGLEFVGVPLKPDFSLDKEAMLAAIAQHKPVVTYLAYPNNPTGNLFNADDMVEIIRAVGDTGIVVIDEAYQPFAQSSFMPRLSEFSNIVVMRTVSKLGLAGIRLGYMAADAALLAEFDKVRPPYNVNVLTQAAAEFVLDHADVLDAQAENLRAERAKLATALQALPGIEVFPSAANFLLIRLAAGKNNADSVFSALLDRKVLIKNVGKMHPLLENCLRVTVSTPEENQLFLDALKASLAS